LRRHGLSARARQRPRLAEDLHRLPEAHVSAYRLARRLARLLDLVYPEPRPFESAEELARAHHDDVPTRTLDELDAERILARIRWAATIHTGAEPSRWLRDRLELCDAAAERLRARHGQRSR
jgi:hypothetical protein